MRTKPRKKNDATSKLRARIAELEDCLEVAQHRAQRLEASVREAQARHEGAIAAIKAMHSA